MCTLSRSLFSAVSIIRVFDLQSRKMSKKVCIIGAGAAGLCAARHCASLEDFQPVVYEQTSGIGGTWVFNPNIGEDDHGLAIHSSMYRNLKTNLPKEVMAFPDFPFDKEEPESFLHHTKVCRYLRDYASHFDLSRFIQFQKLVKQVTPTSSGFRVDVADVRSGAINSTEFAAVIVCNGHYSDPSMPRLPGLAEHFAGTIMHSHDYREPSPFKDKVVAVLGAAASGTDIGIEVASEAKKVYLCHNNPVLPAKLPDSMSQRKGIEQVTAARELRLTDGSFLNDVDVLLFCTGYNYTFPFLDSSCRPKVENRVVSPLYKHMIHINFPRLCFIGIPIQICPFPQFDLQVQLFVKSLSGDFQLPSRDAMLADTEEEKSRKLRAGIPAKHFHKMGNAQWDYNRSLCKLAGLPHISIAVENLYNDVWAVRRGNLTTYKESVYKLDARTHSYERIA